MTLMLTDFTKNILRLYFTGTGKWANANYKFTLMKKGDKELYYKSSVTSPSSSANRALPYEALLALTDSDQRSVTGWVNSDVATFADITQSGVTKSSDSSGNVAPYLIQPIDKNEIDVNDIDSLSFYSSNLCFKNPSSLKWLISSVNGLGTIRITVTNKKTTDSVTVNRLVILSKRVLEYSNYIYYKPDAASTATQVGLFCMPLAYVDIDPVTVAPGETYVFQIHIPGIEMQVEEEETT